MPKLVLHHFDVFNEEYISGWCFNRLTPWRPVRITAQLDGIEIASISCDRYREDVQESGLHRSGKCGFLLNISNAGVSQGALLSITTEHGIKILAEVRVDALREVIRSARPAVFVHIPKTAGTSFNNDVQGWFGHLKWHNHIEALTTKQRRELLLADHYVAGHLPLYRIREVEPDLARLNLHTILRKPCAQLHSHLAWVKGIGQDRNDPFFSRHPPVVQELASRLQTESVSSPAELARFVGRLSGFELDFFDNIQTRYLADHRPDRVGQSDCQQAIRNLSRFSTVGLTERYQSCLDDFAAFYDCPSAFATSRHNPARVQPLFDIESKEIQEALAPLIRFDDKLYYAAAVAD